jgi:hypothetical protein
MPLRVKSGPGSCHWLQACALVAAAALPPPANANDSTAELGAGGLVFGRSDAVSMVEEDLFLSIDEVRVRYLFRNTGDKDVTTIVAFPMPDITFGQEGDSGVPDGQSDNFLGFTVRVDGEAVTPQLQQRAFASGLDVTDELVAAGIPLQGWSDDAEKALGALSGETAEALGELGAVAPFEFDAGQGWTKTHEARWTLRSAYFWTMTFPAGADVIVEHDYKPAAGGSAGLTFSGVNPEHSTLDAYRQKYCMDDAFLKAVKKREGEGGFLFEQRLSYILTTGANWAGPIGRLAITVDKGSPQNLVSFCGEGVEKIGATTFRMEYKDHWPLRDLDILIVAKGDM